MTLIGVFIILFLSSCKSIYRFEEDECSSEFILYRENFKYTEKTPFSDFHVWGRYVVKDSIVQLFYDKEDRLPYSFSKSNIITLSENLLSKTFSVKTIDARSNQPLIKAALALRDGQGEVIESGITDLSGIAQLPKNADAKSLEIHYIGYATQYIDYSYIVNHDIEIVLDEYKAGGRRSGGCLVTFLDLILEYKIDDSKEIKSLERNGVTFSKIN